MERAEEYDNVDVKGKLFEVKEKVVKNKDLKLASGFNYQTEYIQFQ